MEVLGIDGYNLFGVKSNEEKKVFIAKAEDLDKE